MGRKIFQIAFIVLVLLAFAKAITDYLSKLISDPNEFEFYIESAPGGQLSRTSNLTFQFAQDFESDEFNLNEPITQKLIHFTPRINGTFYWIDARTLEFLPKEPLPSNTSFFYRINLNNIYQSKERLRIYRNKFSTPEIQFDANFHHLTYIDSVHFNINGSLSFTDQIDFKTVHQILTAQQGNKKLPIQIKQGERNLSYQFTIKDVIRKQSIDSVQISWYKNYELTEQESFAIPIPSIDDFVVLKAQLDYENETNININFSNEIDLKADSLIQILGADIRKRTCDKNIYRIYLNDSSIQESLALSINQNFTNSSGLKLKKDFFLKINLNNYLPQLENIQNQALINLNNNKTILPFKAKNLRQIQVEIYEISQQNALQFLQINKSNLPKEIQRVGKKINKSNIKLEQKIDYQPEVLKSYQIPFTFIAPQKGSIIYYQLSFTDKDLAYHPKDSAPIIYDTITQSITYTPIQVVAKITPTDTLLVQVYNTEDERVVRNAKVELFDYQQHKLSSSQTNKFGETKIRFNGQIAFLRVTYLGNISYLKLNNEDGENYEISNYLNPFFFSNQTVYQAKDSVQLGLIFDSDHLSKNGINKIHYELLSPKGTLIYSKVLSFNSNEIVLFKHQLPSKLTNGKYQAKFTVNNFPFYKQLTINSPNNYTRICTQENTLTNSNSTSTNLFEIKKESTIVVKTHQNLPLKSSYNLGDTISFSLESGNNCFAHFSIENNAHIIESKWINPINDKIIINTVSNKDYWPNVEISMHLFDKNGQIITHKQIVKFKDTDKLLEPIIISKFDFESGKKETIRIKENSGKPLNYIIKLSTSDSTKHNPFLHFNQTFLSTIKSFGYDTQPTLAKNENTLNTFILPEPIADNDQTLYGPFFLAKNETNTHALNIPNILGKGSIEVIGIDEQLTKYAYSQKIIHIHKPIVVELEKPSFIQPNEIILIKTKVIINQAKSKTALIDIKSPTNCSFYDDTEFSTPLESGTNNFEFHLKVKANKVCENASFILTIEDSTQRYEEKIILPIKSLNPNTTTLTNSPIQANSQWQTRITPLGFKGSNTGVVEFSSHPSVSYSYLLKKLSSQNQEDIPTKVAYCLSLIHLYKITALTQLHKDSITATINECLNHLTLLMNHSKFELTTLDLEDNSHFNLLAGQLFIEALKNNYWINSRVLNNWSRNIEFEVEFTDIQEKEMQLNLCKQIYLLSLLDKANRKVMDDLYALDNLSIPSSLYLALAYVQIGSKKKALNIFEEREKESANNEMDLTTNILLFQLSHSLNILQKRDMYLKAINDYILSNKPYSNEQLCHYLNNSAKYLSETKKQNNLELDFRLNKGKAIEIKSHNLISYSQIPIEFTLPKTIDIKNYSEKIAYSQISVSGISEIPGPVKLKSPINLEVSYYDSIGESFKPNNLLVNQCFQCEVVLINSTNNPYKNLIITIPYATGWNLDAIEANNPNYYLVNPDDNLTNKLIYLAHVPKNGTIHISLSFSAKYPGNFILSPITLFHQTSNQVWQQTKISYSNIAP